MLLSDRHSRATPCGERRLIGTVSDFLFDDRLESRWLVVDTGTWLSGRMVLIIPRRSAGRLRAARAAGDPDEGKGQGKPDLMQDQPVSQQMEDHLYDYYGWDQYWAGELFRRRFDRRPLPPYFKGMTGREAGEMWPVRMRRSRPAQHRRRHATTSTPATAGSAISRTSSSMTPVGHPLPHHRHAQLVAGRARAAVALCDPGNQLVGHEVRLDVSRERVRSSPPWNPLEALDEAYEKRLHGHYDWPGYGW